MLFCSSHEMLASTYFGRQELGADLENIARYVIRFARDADDLGRRSARRADLTAAAQAAARLQAALKKIDLSTQAEAMRARLAALDWPDAPDPGAAPPGARQADRTPEILGALERMHGTLGIMADSFVAMAEATQVSRKGGRPKRPDPLQAGLEALCSLWLRESKGPVTASFKQGGYGALAIAMLAAPFGPYESRIVEGAVTDFVAELPASAARLGGPA